MEQETVETLWGEGSESPEQTGLVSPGNIDHLQILGCSFTFDAADYLGSEF